jgi:phosphohistidine phosphatase SixA
VRARKPTDPPPVRLLLRHADAGVRAEWRGSDEWRGLSPLGWDQAEEVAVRLDGLPLRRVLSSPSLRCRQTVMPLARGLLVDVEPERELAIGADPQQLLRLLQDPETEGAVLCTHRETLEALLRALGHPVPAAGGPAMEKAAAWLLGGALGDGIQPLPARRTVVPAGRPGSPV